MRYLKRSALIRHLGIPMLFLAALPVLVHALPLSLPQSEAEKAGAEKVAKRNGAGEILRDVSILPAPVARMRSAILGAVSGGNIEDMRIPVDMNEIPPVLAAGKVADPIAYWKKISGDGEGREILATLVQLFRTGFVRKISPQGHEMYVWPYFAEMPLDKLTPAQEVELLTLVPAAKAKEMHAKGKYDHFRLGIGGDGVWHFFQSGAQ